jgi:hypothetical protein
MTKELKRQKDQYKSCAGCLYGCLCMYTSGKSHVSRVSRSSLSRGVVASPVRARRGSVRVRCSRGRWSVVVAAAAAAAWLVRILVPAGDTLRAPPVLRVATWRKSPRRSSGVNGRPRARARAERWPQGEQQAEAAASGGGRRKREIRCGPLRTCVSILNRRVKTTYLNHYCFFLFVPWLWAPSSKPKGDKSASWWHRRLWMRQWKDIVEPG